MDRYKFKAYYKPLKIMLQPEQIESINFETQTLGVYMDTEDNSYHKLRLSDFELLQFTGLHDDTDDQNELFEDDITEIVYKEEKHVCKIQYCAGGFMFVADSLPDGYLFMSVLVEFDRKYGWVESSRKLGNIHDNPERLEA